MKRFIKIVVCFVIIILLSITTIVKADNEVFSELDFVKESSVITNKEVEGGVKLNQISTIAYNDGIINDSRINDYVVSWFDYSANPSARIVNWTTSSINDWSGGKATVLAEKYEQSHPGYIVVGAINGDFFRINDNDEVKNVSVQEGEVIKPVVWGALGTGVIGWTYDGKIVSGNPTLSSNMYLEILDDNGNKVNETIISNVNKNIADTGIALLTKDIEKNGEIKYDFTNMTVVELEYNYHRFSLDGNEHNDRLFIKGNVTKISKDLNADSVIPEGCVYLVAKDNSLDHIAVDDTLRLQYHLTNEWEGVVNTTGYYAQILKDGESLFYQSSNNSYENVVGDPAYINCKKNRTVIGKKDDGSTVMMTIEYNKDGNYGASYYECAEYLRSVGCVEGWLLDGGGSTSMALRDSRGNFDLICGGSDGHERSNGNAMLLVVKDPGITPIIESASRFSATLNLQTNDSPFVKDVYDIKFELNNKTYDYDNEAVTVEGLEEDTKYTFTVYYKMKLDDEKIVEGKKSISFETFTFNAPNVTFDSLQRSNTELVLSHTIRKANGVEISNFKIYQGENEYVVNPGESIHITNLKPLTNYEFYATFDAYDPDTANTYHITTPIYECATLSKPRPIITCFKLVKHAGTVLEFEYSFNDVDNQVEEAYIEYFGTKIAIEGTSGVKRLEGFDLRQATFKFTFRLKTANGEIVSDKIVIEKMDELPPAEEINNNSNKKCGKKNLELVVGIISATACISFIFKKRK